MLFQRTTFVTAATFLLVVACGKANLGGNGKATQGLRLGSGSAGNCLKLGDAGGPTNQLTHTIIPSDGGKGGNVIGDKGSKGVVDVVVVPTEMPVDKNAAPIAPAAPLSEPTPPGNCVSQTPSQAPVVTPQPVVVGDYGKDGDGGKNNPGQFPAPRPYDQSACGKGSLYCAGGPGQAPQWPGHSVGGGRYSHDDVAACMNAFHNAGMNVGGQWNIDVRSSLNVTVLSSGVFDDHTNDHALIIVNSVSVLGKMHFNLLNPNALYCLKDVSVLEKVSVTSCHQSNVVSLKDVAVLSTKHIEVVNCAAP